MKKTLYLALAAASVLVIVLFAGVFGPGGKAPAAEHAAKPDFPCLNPPSLSPEFPGDTVLSDQPSFNCFAWSEFIAANWPKTGGAENFGTPHDLAPVTWEGYMNIHDLLNADGTPPPPWGQSGSAPATVAELTSQTNARIISRASKLGGNFIPDKDINEASPHVAWLADTKSNLVFFEIVVNEAEYTYFTDHELYNSEAQKALMASGGRIDLPKGSVEGGSGAVEIKAAWLSLPVGANLEDWSRYKLSEGFFCSDVGKADEVCEGRVLALVGMHILHKSASQASWTWATFDHVDNVPDAADVAQGQVPERDYRFYSPSCKEQEVPQACLAPGKSAASTTCTPNQPPAYALSKFVGSRVEGPCQPYPIQATRVYPLPDTGENPIVRTNTAAQQMIAAANPDSVFQYYQLINVMWSDSPVDENVKVAGGPEDGPKAPLSKTAFRPDPAAFPVSNPVLETYVQSTACVECHSNAAISGGGYASDYSFLFSFAGP
ncbi:hypothetical protein [Marinovum sp.]|uniref:hypothetical protein n=1 Tax=Marinovum sp. TaxID=2024839 RepID=UPI003A8EA9BD